MARSATSTAGGGSSRSARPASAVASLVCAIAPSVELLIVARGLQGAFGALLVPSSLAIITTVFGPGERAAAIGSWTAGTSGAIAFGPPLGGVLIDVLSWRVIFALNVPLVLACLWLIRSAVPSIPAESGPASTSRAPCCASVGLAGPTYALIQQPLLGWSDPQVWAPLIGGLGALLAFVNCERHAPDPMLPPAIFRSRNFAIGNLVTLSVYAGLSAAAFFIAIFLQQVGGTARWPPG